MSSSPPFLVGVDTFVSYYCSRSMGDRFGLVLYLVYGEAVSDEVLGIYARDREIIDAADKFGMKSLSLRLQAESSFVKANTISIDN